MKMKELTKAADEVSRCLDDILRELEIREAEVFRLFF
jgi:hypothetical protein